MDAPSWVTALVAVTVTAVWASSLAVGFVQHDYTPLTIVTPCMIVLVGYATGVKIIRRQNGGEE